MTARWQQRVLLVVLLALLTAIGVTLLTGRGSAVSPPAQLSNSPFAGPAMPPNLRAAGFSLTDQNGRRVTLAQYRGKVVVLTFIHSLCHDACPLMVEAIKGALDDLPASGRGIPAVGITVAPAEDSVARRRWFLRTHRMTGRLSFLSGPAFELRRVWRAYAVQPVTPKVDHSTFVILIDKRGVERIGFPADQLRPEDLAHDIRLLERQRA
ncbi:MAG TPA: SCO family protein [Solirubrobacteraceae bacterium]